MGGEILCMKGFTINLIFLACLVQVIAAQGVTLSGYVTDKTSGERLIGASIYLPKINAGTVTNSYGFFSITCPGKNDSILLQVSYTGYNIWQQYILLNTSQKIHIELQVLNALEEVVVTSSKRNDIQNRTQMSSVNLTADVIKSLPSLLGEADVLKAIQLLPGVQGGSEGSSGLYVRGGGPDQNLILLDGVPVYNASHLFGFFSVFNADAINNVEVIKGGFPARYGGRLSSVIDIRMKEGNNKEFHGEGSLGLISSRLTLEGPFKKGTSSYIISARRTYADIIMEPLIKKQVSGLSKAGYYFYDVNAKINLALRKRDHVYLSNYVGTDKFNAQDNYTDPGSTNTYEAGVLWGNTTGVVRWNHEFSPRLFSNVTVNYTRYKFNIYTRDETISSFNNTTYIQKYKSGIEDFSAKIDMDWLRNPNHTIKMGMGSILHRYRPGAFQSKATSSTSTGDTTLNGNLIKAIETEAYIEDDVKLTNVVKANAGLHGTLFSVGNKTFYSLQPRLALRYLLSSRTSIKASYSTMQQFIHLLTNSGIGLPTDLWVPATNTVPPQRSYQWAAGWAYNINPQWELSTEVYYKKMKNIIEYAEGASFVNTSTNWETRVETGKGSSYGTEVFVQKKRGKLTGIGGYTLSWTNRQFNHINNGNWFPYKYDRRHDVKLAGVYELSKKITLSADWVYGTGVATTLPVAIYTNPSETTIEIYTGRNDYRLPAYHRMDIGIKFLKKKKYGERTWAIDIYNLYNRQNAFFIYRDEEYTLSGQRLSVFRQVSLFPILPSVSYHIKF